jgi:CDP-glucose 4,6-dehydratase
MSGYWDHVTWSGDTESVGRPHEAGLLKLCCDKSLASLGWHATMSFRETVAFTTQWYRHFYAAETDMEKITRDQIRQFCTLGVERGLRWAK